MSARWLLLLLLWPQAALATYSIAGVDTATGEVGGVGTSCVGRFSVYRIYGSAPGQGVVLAQAFLNEDGRDRAVQLLMQGASAEEALTMITAPGFDGDAARRQYAVVDLSPSAQAFTGDETGAWSGHRTGQIGSFSYSAQGNILTGPEVVDQAADAFEASGCDLADRLMNALIAGAQGGIGDSRCTPMGIPSDGAFIQVDLQNGDTLLSLRVDDTSPDDPLTLLEAQYRAWRQANPCPMRPDAGVPDTGVDAGVDLADQGTDQGARDAGAEPGVDAGPSGDVGASIDAGSSTDAGEAEESKGCTCASPRPELEALRWLWLAPLLLQRRLRRLRRRREDAFS